MKNLDSGYFKEIPVFCDEEAWVWHFLDTSLKESGIAYKKLPSSVPLRSSWQRFKKCQRMIIHWESQSRPGGALIEEILEINPFYDVAQNLIVVTSSPMREDIVYLSELGVRRILRLRHKESDLKEASKELHTHLAEDFTRDPIEVAWQKIHRAIDFLSKDAPKPHIAKIESGILRLSQTEGKASARFLDALASVRFAKRELQKAEKLWLEALHTNPNYFRAHNNLIHFYQAVGKQDKALDLLSRMHNLNRSKIGRLVEFGNSYLAKKDDYKAEHYFKRALSKDQYCSGALNGLAEIRFRHGDLEEARQLLARTALAYQFAAQLNQMGIELVKKSRFSEALELYTRAQYVLPQYEKGPKLFYNIGLCYFRWDKPALAKEFLKIALVKEPAYKKCSTLLKKIEDSEKAAA